MFTQHSSNQPQPSNPFDPSKQVEARHIIHVPARQLSLEDVADLYDVGCRHFSRFCDSAMEHEWDRALDALEMAQETYQQLPLALQSSHWGSYLGHEVGRALDEARAVWEAED